MSAAPWEGKSRFVKHIIKSTYYYSNPDWVWYDENGKPHMTELAPPEAIESYIYWQEMLKKQEAEGVIYY